jgi:hypothetical protein
MAPRASLLSAAAGAVLLVGTPVAWYASQPPETVGDLDAVTAPPAPVEPADAAVEEDEEEDADGTAAVWSDDAEVRRLTPAPEPAPLELSAGEVSGPISAPSTPSSIRIDTIGVDAPVVPVGLEPDGAMEIPHDVSTIGWYELGVLPGEDGTAVLSGHVDSRTQGRGAFFDLRHLDVDDRVTVAGEDGAQTDWRVVARTSYPKDELPIEDIFTRFSDPRLVLITCGGAFDSDTRHYQENVVVYAEPVAG